MNIMYIGFEGFDTKNGTNHLIKTLLSHLIRKGHNLTYINSRSLGHYKDIPDELASNPNFRYFILKRKPVDKRRFLLRYLASKSYVRRMKLLFKSNSFKTDVVIIQSTPTAYATHKAIEKYIDCIFILNSFDIFPDGIKKLKSIQYRPLFNYLTARQLRMYSKMDYIIVNSLDVKNTFLKKGIDPSKLFLVYNWYDSDKSNPVMDSENVFIKSYRIDRNKFIIQYAGNFGFTFNYKKVIEIARKLRVYQIFEFHMIGEGALMEEFKRACKETQLTNIMFFPYQDEVLINHIYSACDLQLVPLEKDVIFNSYPSKVSLVLSLGKIPIVIAEKDSVFFSHMNKQRFGFCFDMLDSDDVVNTILSLYEDDFLRMQLSEICSKTAKTMFSSEVNLKRFDVLLKEVAERLV